MALPLPSPPDEASLGAFELTGELLGRGGFADVWAARHRATGWPVAIKQPRAETRPLLGESLSLEARALARVQHPTVVRILDVLDDDCIVMERAQATVAERPTTGWAELRALLLAVLDALAEVHSHGLLHRDIKPSNLLLGVRRGPREPLVMPTDGLRLADFGIAIHHLEPARWPMAGSPAFQAPEQRRGDPVSFGPWTDLFAVGRLARILADPLAAVPPDLGDWIAWLAADDPRDRPDRAIEAAASLVQLAEAQVVVGAPTPAPASMSEQSTLVHLDAVVRDAPDETGLRPPGTRRLPDDWRTAVPPWPAVELMDAGAGLQHLRVPRIVGQEDLRDRLWAALGEVAERGEPRRIVLQGRAGSGRRALAQWLAARAHAVGAAEVERVDARHPWVGEEPPGAPQRVGRGERVHLWVALDPEGVQAVEAVLERAEGPVLAVFAREGRGEAWRVPPLTEAAMRLLVRRSLTLVPGLVDHVVERSGGIPGRVHRWFEGWIRAGRLVATPDGYRHLDGERPIARTRTPEGPYADLVTRVASGEAEAAWEAFVELPESASTLHLEVGLEILDALGADLDDVRRLRLEVLRERRSGVDQAGQWARMEALGRRARRVGAESLVDEIELHLAQWQYTRHGDAQGAWERLAAARERIVARDDHALLCLVHIKSVWPSVLLGRHEEAATLADRASELADTAPELRPYAQMMRARVYSGIGRHPEAIESCRVGLEAVGEGQDSYRGHLLVVLGDCLLGAGRPAEAVESHRAAIALSSDKGWLELEGIAQNNLGWGLFQLGRVDEAEVHLRSALDRYRTTNRSDTAARLGLSIMALAQGEPEAARAMLDDLEVGGTVNVEVMALHAALARAWCAAALGESDAWPDALCSPLVGPARPGHSALLIARRTAEAARAAGWGSRAAIVEAWLADQETRDATSPSSATLGS